MKKSLSGSTAKSLRVHHISRLAANLALFAAASFAQAPQPQWARQFGTQFGGQNDFGKAATAAGGYYYVAGHTVTNFPGQPAFGGWDILVRKYDGSGNIIWTRQIGSNNTDWGYGIAADANGNVFITGQSSGVFNGQPHLGSGDAFLAKLDSSGTTLWVRQFGTSAADIAYAVAVDANGNPCVTGTTQGALTGLNAGAEDAFVRKFDTNGNTLFTDQFGSSAADEGRAISMNTAGEIVVGGWATAALPSQTHFGGQDGFLRKYSPTGTVLWTYQFGNAGTQQVHGLSYAPDGTFFAALWDGGGQLRHFDPGAGTIWNVNTGGSPFAVAADASGVSVAGSVNGSLPGQTSAGGSDAFAGRYTYTGAAVWTQQLGTAQNDEALGVAVDATGTFAGGTTFGVLPGQSAYGDGDIWARKWDTAGIPTWTNQFGGLWPGSSSVLSTAARSSVYTAGHTSGPLAGNTQSGSTDAFVTKHDLNGAPIWTRQFGTGSRDFGRAVAVDAAGNVYVGGSTSDAFPGKTKSSPVGYDDAFLRKYDANGAELWTLQFGINTSGDTRIQAAATDSSGNLIVLGITPAALPGQSAAGNQDAFLRSYDPNGNILWTRQFGTSGYDYGLALTLTPTGIIAAGYTQGAFPGFTKVGSVEGFVATFDAAGTPQWTHQFNSGPGTTTLIPWSATAAADGSVYVAGYLTGSLPGQTSQGGQDAFLRKISNTGTELWSRQFGTASPDDARGVVLDNSGNILVGGHVEVNLPGISGFGFADLFLRKYDPTGNELATIQYGGSGFDRSNAPMAVDSNGGVYLAGYTTGSVGGQTQTPGAFQDALLVKFFSGLSATSTSLTVNANPSVFGTPVSFTAVVSGGSPSGTVSFLDGATVIGTSSLVSGTAVFTTSALAAGTHSITAAYSGDANHQPSTSAALSFSVTQAPQVITLGPLPGLTFGDAPFSLTATGGPSGQPVTFTVSGNCAISSSLVTITGAGSCNIYATQAGNANYLPASLSASIPIAKAPAAITLGNLNQVADGTPRVVSVVTSPTGLAGVTVTYNGSPTPPVAPGIYPVMATLVNANYQAAPVTANLIVTAPPDLQAPAVTDLALSANPLPLGSATALTAIITDSGSPASNIARAEYSLDNGASWQPFPGTYNVATQIAVSVSLTPATGVYSVCVRGTDAALNASVACGPLLAVFDPSAGFVTGAGWILSPAGALTANPSAEGKATFGFVSRYQRGNSIPSGNTEFQFKAGSLNFKSTEYEWLVIAGARAQYKGSGTINGSGDFAFMLTAIDGETPGGGGSDRFRIKIWNKQNGGVIYDNQIGKPDDGSDATELGGGSIILHQ
jgi:hypothetical protein